MASKTSFMVASFALVLSIQAQAANVITTVFNVFDSETSKHHLILSAADGRIYRSPITKESKKFFSGLVGQIVNIEYEEQATGALITDIRPVDPETLDDPTLEHNYFTYSELRQFAPTDLQSPIVVEDVFKSMLNDGDKRRSECFKRAHIWAFDMWSKQGIFSEKIFIFYTKRYAILEDFKWWFHVAPMVRANGEEFVLDATFMDKPSSVKDWITYFMRTDKITCPEIQHYDEVDKNQWKKLCLIMKTSMFHFSPLDIEFRDRRGMKRNHWVLPELQDARRAFKNYETVYEGLDNGKPTKTF